MESSESLCGIYKANAVDVISFPTVPTIDLGVMYIAAFAI